MMDPRILSALEPLVEAFEKMGVLYQICGSVASSVHGVPRSSLDIDLLASMEPDQVDELVRRIDNEFYVSQSRVAEAVEQEKTFNVIHLQTMFKLDIFIVRTERFRCQSLSRRRLETLGDATRPDRLFVTSAEDIVLHKLDWFRKGGETSELQWQDILGVLRVQGESLDLSYMKEWAGDLSVTDLLKRALVESDLGN